MRFRSIIGKHAAMAAVLIAAAALAFAIWGNKEAGRRAQEASSGLNSYDYELTFLPEESALDVTMTLLCANRTGSSLDDLLLRTWAGAYQLEATSPAASEELYAACYPGGFSPGGIAIQDVTLTMMQPAPLCGYLSLFYRWKAAAH